MNTQILATLLIVASLVSGCGATETAKNDIPATAPAPVPPTPAPAEPEVPVPAIDLATLAIKIDPVCKMSLEEYPATSTADHAGKTYGFCSEFCKKKFVASPESMLARLAAMPAGGEPKP